MKICVDANELVSWSVTLAATNDPCLLSMPRACLIGIDTNSTTPESPHGRSCHYPQLLCSRGHGLAPWSFTFAAKAASDFPPATNEISLRTDSDNRENPRHKAVGSGESRSVC